MCAILCSLPYNDLGVSGAEHLAGALKENKTLTSLEYAAAPLHSDCQEPLTLVSALVCSLEFNDLRAAGAEHVAGALKENKTLTSLRYAATHLLTLPSRAADIFLTI